MSESSYFESVRREPDPLERGRRATELLTIYQQRSTELARLRRAAIEQAHDTGMTFTEIAAAMGVTKGRITQIRGGAPSAERALFGVGPIAIGVPYRYQTTDRERPLIAAEDARAGDSAEQLLTTLGFAVSRFQIEPDTTELPEGDTLLVCGPKSAPIAAELLNRDPVLTFINDRNHWAIVERDRNIAYRSPTDDDPAKAVDLAYLARHELDGRTVVHIAGIHAIGSLGVLHYLTARSRALYDQTKASPFSCVVKAEYEALAITGSELAAGPFLW